MPPKSSKTAGAGALKKGTAQPIGNFFKAQKRAGRSAERLAGAGGIV